ncbi:MAG: hypothetical protein AB8G11_05230 [Saprospiraceae bacterium]
MKKIITYTLLFVILFSCSKDELNVLPPNTIWEKELYRGNDDQQFNNIEQNSYALQNTPDNGFVVALNEELRKYSAEGDSLWQKSYTQPIKAIQKINNEEYLLCGNTEDQIWIAKTNADWDVIWETQFDFEASQPPFIKAIAIGNDGYYLAFRIGQNENARSRLYKVNLNGNLAWEKQFISQKSIEIHSMKINSAGNLFAVGGANRNSTYTTKPWFAQIDNNNGSILKEEIFEDKDIIIDDRDKYEHFSSIQERSNGDFILLINSDYNSDVIILNEANEIQYRNDLRSSNFHSMTPIKDNHWLLLNQGNHDNYCFAKLDDNGHRIWQLRFSEISDFGEILPRYGISTCQLTDGNYILLSQTYNRDAYFITKIEQD